SQQGRPGASEQPHAATTNSTACIRFIAPPPAALDAPPTRRSYTTPSAGFRAEGATVLQFSDPSKGEDAPRIYARSLARRPDRRLGRRRRGGRGAGRVGERRGADAREAGPSAPLPRAHEGRALRRPRRAPRPRRRGAARPRLPPDRRHLPAGPARTEW